VKKYQKTSQLQKSSEFWRTDLFGKFSAEFLFVICPRWSH